MPRLVLVRDDERIWKVEVGNVPVAELYLDRLLQLDRVVLSRSITPKDRLAVLRLALSHVMSYYRLRDVDFLRLGDFSRIFGEPKADPMEKSAEAMSFRAILKVVAGIPEARARKGLAAWYVEVIDRADLRSPVQIVKKVCTPSVLKGARVSFEATLPFGGGGKMWVLFRTKGKARFTCWRHVSSGEQAPITHPSRRGMKSLLMVNGTTRSVIDGRERVIEEIDPPQDGKTMGGLAWGSCKGFYASGPVITVSLLPSRLLGPKGEAQLRDFLLAALGMSNSYIAVSGLGERR